jgi:hypothetical protein
MPESVQHRARLERRIVRSLVTELLAHGLTLAVFNGEECYPATNDRQLLYSQLIETDEDIIDVMSGDIHKGSIKLTYGNDGFDVMSDWHTCLDTLMPKTLALVEYLELTRLV